MSNNAHVQSLIGRKAELKTAAKAILKAADADGGGVLSSAQEARIAEIEYDLAMVSKQIDQAALSAPASTEKNLTADQVRSCLADMNAQHALEINKPAAEPAAAAADDGWAAAAAAVNAEFGVAT